MKPPAHERFKASYFRKPRKWRDVHPIMRRRVLSLFGELVLKLRSQKDEDIREALRIALDELRKAPRRGPPSSTADER